uniref:OBG-type G domain-containing protein n=1 Tax=Panagrellus redivivus TaxID=6233 RepID=A0A7E4USY0_PANRE
MKFNNFTPFQLWLSFIRKLSSEVANPFTKNPVLPKKKKGIGEAARFIDYRRVKCVAGNGGNGMVSFLRGYGTPFGGPDGGNGGHGGHVLFEADSSTKDLYHIGNTVKARNGTIGMGKCCHGANAEHLHVKVPLNTLVKEAGSSKVLHELFRPGEIFIGARGGAGGHGNHFYLSNEVRKPMKAELGGRGEVVQYDLEMRVMATAGLVGFPNAGKSTLLRAVSRAKPKVAAYPFTTLVPHVGIVHYDDFEQVAIADIPGIIEGAHRNVGLGCSFLRHIQRCRCLFYVLDLSLGDLPDQLAALKTELQLYDEQVLDKDEEALMSKPSAIVINKSDLDPTLDEAAIASAFAPLPVFAVSAKMGRGLVPLLNFLRGQYDDYVEEQKARIAATEDDYVLKF